MLDFMDMGYDDPVESTGSGDIPDAGECMRCGMCISGCRLISVQYYSTKNKWE
jgi:glycolate oxidase iron-sulfur subunit